MRKFLFVFALVLVLSVCSVSLKHECKHDALQKRIFEQMNKQHKRGIVTDVKYKNTTKGLKIDVDKEALLTPQFDFYRGMAYACSKVGEVIYYEGRPISCSDEDVVTQEKKDVVEAVVDAVFPIFEGMLSTWEIDGTIELDEGSYSGDICIGGVHCHEESTDEKIRNLTKGEQLYIQVTMRPEEGSTYATGVALQFDQNMRPIVGHVNFNVRLMPSSINKNSALWKELTGVALHETMHVLGFSNSMFHSFINASSGQLYDNPVVTIENPQDGHVATIITTPHVKEAVRRQFGCDSLEGAPLEDQGGAGTAASHWEKAVFMDEVMTGSASSSPVLSNVTLALLEDSGWYFPNYEFGERLVWGENRGCKFVQQNCENGWPKSEADGYFCEEKDKQGCTYDRTARGLCSIKQYSNLPKQYQHLSDPALGGTVVLADYCPFVRAYSNGLCTDTSISKTYIYGDEPGERSKCYLSKVSLSPISSLLDKQEALPLCYPTVCISPTELATKIGNYWYNCPSGKNISNIHGYFGSLDCPDASVLCGGTYDLASKQNIEFIPIPSLTSITPLQGKAGDEITVCGNNINVNVTIKVGAGCIEPRKTNNSCVTCKINTTSGFKTVFGIVDLTLTYKEYTTIYDKAFTVTLDLKAWAKRNAFFLFALLFSIVLFILVVLTVIVKCHKTKKRYREYQARVRKAKAARAAKEERAARGEVEMEPVS